MDKRELYLTLEELRTGLITTDMAMEQILLLLGAVERSEQLVCDECNFVELQDNIYQCTKCYKVEDRLAN